MARVEPFGFEGYSIDCTEDCPEEKEERVKTSERIGDDKNWIEYSLTTGLVTVLILAYHSASLIYPTTSPGMV